MLKKEDKPAGEWVAFVNHKIIARSNSFKEVYNISEMKYKNHKIIYCNIVNTLFALI